MKVFIFSIFALGLATFNVFYFAHGAKRAASPSHQEVKQFAAFLEEDHQRAQGAACSVSTSFRDPSSVGCISLGK